MSVEDLMAGLAELDEARPAYEKAEKFYEGRFTEVFASAKLRRLLSGISDDFLFNFAKIPVNVVANRLEIAAVVAPDKGTTTTLREKVWAPNLLDLEAPNLHRRACEYGDAYLIVWPGEEDGAVEVHYNSPLTTRAIYSQENPRQIEYVVKCWAEGGKKRANLYYPDVIEKWVTKGKCKGGRKADWEEFEEEDVAWPLPNPWGVLPVFHYRTDLPYGVPEHRDAYGPQNAITKTIVTGVSTTDAHAFPQRAFLADPDVGSDEADDFGDDDEEAADGPGDESSLKSEPGTVWWLKGVKSAIQFDAADPDAFLKPLEVYIKAMAHLTDTPPHRFHLSGQHPSGQALREADAPTVAKVRNRQLYFGATWRDALQFALKILGIEAVVDVRWSPPTRIEDKDGWETIGLKVESGVPRRQALLEAGYTADQVDVWLADATDDEDLRRRVTLLAELGNAVQRLGAGVQFGVIGEDQVNAVIERIIDDSGATEKRPVLDAAP